ncbi:MAG: glutamate-5-semialdehyde dehydrogenase [Oscillospiraceae bacterium]|nr:glutamate-5-semialdehyde dehydrogenase [Oscillospiraceae bacterium]
MTALQQQGKAAKEAARILATASESRKNQALEAIAAALLARSGEILAANAADLERARANGMSLSLQDRLALTEDRIRGIAKGVREVIALPDPIGETVRETVRPNGLRIGRRRVPLGVIGIIYEARPNVTVDAAVLCLKSGNTTILRGGKEAFSSNQALTEIMRQALESAGLPADCVSLVQDTSRESANELMNLTEYLDVLIPRGGRGLIRAVSSNARVPVIRTGEGVCHTYIDKAADLDMAVEIAYNAKCSRPSVCNAMECVLVHSAVAGAFLPAMAERMAEKNVEFRGDERACAILGDKAAAASEADWDSEYGDYILAVKVVDTLEEAIDFCNAHGTGHSEAIVSDSYTAGQKFVDEVDAAAVYVNASTRFTDGGEFGLGAEIGISTQKMHARGPMGLEELTSTKFVVMGSGQVR